MLISHELPVCLLTLSANTTHRLKHRDLIGLLITTDAVRGSFEENQDQVKKLIQEIKWKSKLIVSFHSTESSSRENSIRRASERRPLNTKSVCKQHWGHLSAHCRFHVSTRNRKTQSQDYSRTVCRIDSGKSLFNCTLVHWKRIPNVFQSANGTEWIEWDMRCG